MFVACIDIGGTFTDLVLYREGADLEIHKSPTTPGMFERGFIDVLEVAARSHDMALADFLSKMNMIVHGTTVSTNALVEGKVAPTGLICNAGHPDILTLRESPRKRAFNIKIDFPPPYIHRSRTCEVRGRIDSMGNEVEGLNDDDVRAAARHLKACGVEAIAVCLLWSIVNSTHECRVREIIEEELPGIPVTLSHELNPIPREYRRTISTAINASLYPIVSEYVGNLTRALKKAGYDGELLIANCVGGMMPPEEIVARPIYSVMSGPTLAPIAATSLTDASNVIVVDMGGTTFDVSALRDRHLVVTPEATFGMEMLGIPKIDVRSVGAGGGSIAWVDVGGLLRVGPHSASAVPGPACYGRGGTEPTVTDANVVLGIIDPDYFLGGRIKLDRAKAEAAVGKIAKQLKIGLMEAAYAIYTTTNHNMIGAIEDITVNEGIDPRDSYVVSGGGATACHIGDMARILGIKSFMVPRFAAGLSAYGGLISDIRWEETGTLNTTDRDFDLAGVNRLLASLKRRGGAFLKRSGLDAKWQRFEFAFQGRYLYQSWDIEVPFDLPEGKFATGALAELVAAFHAQHERIYTIKDEADTVEFTTWKVRAIGDTGGKARRGSPLSPQQGKIRPKSSRNIYFDKGYRDVPVYDASLIGAGAKLEGPAVLELPTTTILLLYDQKVQVDGQGNILVDLAREYSQ
ncbi:hydantoinase/oxoprolinase family protein [Mesorhizobium sp. B4-1-1]|uniref:hydantoinase/oxoprolinase family protein n=1 Tax=Mesorhizobium sp. B4-1-1 TaxID=2589890 RepID=UPI0011296DDC|nr:hydantoinase/oxoprolinase family protein [Mesorhizobium sp. B4-1-1]TPI21497.1 hydantoinase/oxoprolinase family protein [Mesorhizobium sp. B4-1-1]